MGGSADTREEEAASDTRQRLVSVDVLRAVAIAGMLLVNNRSPVGEPPLWSTHVEWEGLRVADVVFPWFLFVAGVSMALSFAARSESPPWLHRGRFALRIVLLFAIGLALTFYAYGEPLRIMGVLQRIALSLAIAAPLARKSPWWSAGAAAILLAVHSLSLAVPPPPDVLEVATRSFEAVPYWVDATLLGSHHLYRGEFEPEGLLGVISSAGQVLLGVAMGRVLVEHPRDIVRLGALAGAALVAVALGAIVSAWLPLIKQVWTASFVLVTSGLAAIALLGLYLVADIAPGQRLVMWAAPLGRSALAAYVGSTLLSTWLRRLPAALPAEEGSASAAIVLATGFVEALGPAAGALAYAGAHVVLWYAVFAALDRSGVRIKL